MRDRTHTFVILAYKESPYLRECVQSLLNQSVKSKVIVSTSTPNALIDSICVEYGIELRVNPNRTGYIGDINYGLSHCTSGYLTLAHQDVIYKSNYTETMLARIKKSKKSLIGFTNYYESREQGDGSWKKCDKGAFLFIKRLMCFPIGVFSKLRIVRRIVFSFGCPICCPSVTFCLDNLPEMRADSRFTNNWDYYLWVQIAKLKGSFVYISDKMLNYKIHGQSATTEFIAENIRGREDLEMLEMFWPKPIARAIYHFYAKAQTSNKL